MNEHCGECPYEDDEFCDPRRTECNADDVRVDMVNHPPHYSRGPTITLRGSGRTGVINCIDVIRHIKDMRLATAMKYIWRVAFGGKENDHEDIEKAIWYLKDWLENKV